MQLSKTCKVRLMFALNWKMDHASYFSLVFMCQIIFSVVHMAVCSHLFNTGVNLNFFNGTF